jgi:dienelactone hydrolase
MVRLVPLDDLRQLVKLARRSLDDLRKRIPPTATMTALAVSSCVVLGIALLTHTSAAETPSWVGSAATIGGTTPAGPAASASSTPSATRPVMPTSALAVGVRTIQLARGGDRPLPTTIWYPAQGRPGGAAKPNAPAARGRFPLVLFSHGIGGLPAYSQQLTIPLAAAGFIVAAPTYPFTHDHATPLNTDDVDNQPADASVVISAVLGLDARQGDPFYGHLNGSVAAGGFSGGALTTAGLLGKYRDPRVTAGIMIAGGRMGEFQGADAALLFIHGDADPVIAYSRGYGAYESTSWPKAFITMRGQGHGEYLRAGASGYNQTIRSMISFLRWSIYGNAASKRQLRRDAVSSVTSFEAAL